MVALEQAQVARSRRAAEALMKMADGYFKRAVPLGWRLPEILKSGRAAE
jgi:hypothetical protein